MYLLVVVVLYLVVVFVMVLYYLFFEIIEVFVDCLEDFYILFDDVIVEKV